MHSATKLSGWLRHWNLQHILTVKAHDPLETVLHSSILNIRVAENWQQLV